MRNLLIAACAALALVSPAKAFDVGGVQHHVDIHAGTLPMEHDENAACVFNYGPSNGPEHRVERCEMEENKAKRDAERDWPTVSEAQRKECLGSLDDENDYLFWTDFDICLRKGWLKKD